MKKISLAAFMVSVLIFAVLTTVHAQSPQQTLNQYVADLQKNPNDNALREKIIRHVQTMRPAPKTPEDVDELVGQAKYVFKHAKTQEDYLGAVEAYKKIVNITPWIGDYYYNLGVAQEQAGQPHDAINSFKLYLLASPNAKDAKEVRERIGGLKYAREKIAKEPRQETVTANKQNEYDVWLKSLDGTRFSLTLSSNDGGRDVETGSAIIAYKYVVVIRGKHALWSWAAVFANGSSRNFGGQTALDIKGKVFDDNSGTFTISDDGAIITYVFSDNNIRGKRVYTRE